MTAMSTQSNSRFFTLRAIKTGLYVLFMGSLLMGSSAHTTAAQSTQHQAPPIADAAAVHELAERLTSPIKEECKQALWQITDLVYRRPEVDLGPTIPALMDIYLNDPDEKYRLWTVAALHAIGDESGMEQVRQRVLQEPSLQVQYVSIAALVDHYGPQAFGKDAEMEALAKNVLVRRQEVRRFFQMQQAGSVLAEQY